MMHDASHCTYSDMTSASSHRLVMMVVKLRNRRWHDASHCTHSDTTSSFSHRLVMMVVKLRNRRWHDASHCTYSDMTSASSHSLAMMVMMLRNRIRHDAPQCTYSYVMFSSCHRLASRAMAVTNHISVNHVMSDSDLAKQYQAELKRLRHSLSRRDSGAEEFAVVYTLKQQVRPVSCCLPALLLWHCVYFLFWLTCIPYRI